MIREQSGEDWLMFDDRNLHKVDFTLKNFKSKYSKNVIFKRLRRPAEYCNLPMAKVNEGENGLGNKWRLSRLYLFIRHGQRASAQQLTVGSNYEYYINCSVDQFPSFQRSDWLEFSRSLDPKSGVLPITGLHNRCNTSQLTLLGVVQFFIAGSRLRAAYRDFLRQHSLQLVSTPYQRSMLSAHILNHLMNRHPQMTSQQSSRPPPIQQSNSLIFCKDQADVRCQCNALQYYYAKYNRLQSLLEQRNTKCNILLGDITTIIGNSQPHNANDSNFERVDDRASTFHIKSFSGVFDIVSAALCASNLERISRANQFCWPHKGETIAQFPWSFLYKPEDDGGDGSWETAGHKPRDTNSLRCMSLQKIHSLWDCFDMRNAEVARSKYFRKYAKLAVYPLLYSILKEISEAEKDEIDIEVSEESQSAKLWPGGSVMVGHDHTLRYLLTALVEPASGARDGSASTVEQLLADTGGWPSYGARISFEIYRDANRQHFVTNRTLTRFRILYEGIDLTPSLLFCNGDNNDHGCSIHKFRRFMSDNGKFWAEFKAGKSYRTNCDSIDE